MYCKYNINNVYMYECVIVQYPEHVKYSGVV